MQLYLPRIWAFLPLSISSFFETRSRTFTIHWQTASYFDSEELEPHCNSMENVTMKIGTLNLLSLVAQSHRSNIHQDPGTYMQVVLAYNWQSFGPLCKGISHYPADWDIFHNSSSPQDLYFTCVKPCFCQLRLGIDLSISSAPLWSKCVAYLLMLLLCRVKLLISLRLRWVRYIFARYSDWWSKDLITRQEKERGSILYTHALKR